MENLVGAEAAKYLSVALCTIPMAVVAWGITKFWMALFDNVGRNPQANNELKGYAMVGFATIEAIALYCLVIAIMMLK
jgi:F-type H+-transporting ATPase subunit c